MDYQIKPFILVLGIVVVLTTTSQAQDFPDASRPDPDASPKDCNGNDGKSCAEKTLEGPNIKGVYSCMNSKCKYCANNFKGCKFNDTMYPCCTKTDGVACVKLADNYAKKYKIDYGCLTPCQGYQVFLDSCTDKNGRKFKGMFKSCSGSKPDTWVYCKDRFAETSTECGATGASCVMKSTKPVDDCCPGLYCSAGKCIPECAEGDDKCMINRDKSPCANVTSVNSNLKTCKDKKGRQFGAPGRYISCMGKNESTFVQCFSTYNNPAECGATGYPCKSYERIKSCCVNFKCKRNMCEPECPTDAKDCKVSLGISACNSETQFKSCKDKKNNTIQGYYLSCKGSKPDTMMQCPNIDYNPQPNDCPIPGSSCTYNQTGIPIDNCCAFYECSTGKCKAECVPGTKCVPNILKQPCAEGVDSVHIKNCTVSGRQFGLPGRFLQCKGSMPNTWLECNSLSSSAPPRECGVTGASCKLFNQTIDSCCTGFVCGLKGTCEPECPTDTRTDKCFINKSFAFCSYHQAPKTCKDSTGVSTLGDYLLCKGNGDNTFVDCDKDRKPRDCGTTGYSCSDKPDICCNKYKCGDDKKCVKA